MVALSAVILVGTPLRRQASAGEQSVVSKSTDIGSTAAQPNARERWFTLAPLLGAVAAYLYPNLFVAGRTPVLLSGDQLFFWMNGQRMLHGELPYRDFFQFTAPGADVLYFLIFKIFGPKIWVVNAVVVLLGIALCWVCFEIARTIMRRGGAVLSSCLFVVLIYSPLLNATHHWFSVLAIMTALAILMRGIDARRLAMAGALLGIACFFTQTHGIVALAAVSIFLKYYGAKAPGHESFWKHERTLLAGFSVAVLLLNAFFIAKVGVGRLFYCQVYYVLRVMVHRPETPLLGMPEYWQIQSHGSLIYEYAQLVFVYLTLPVGYVLALRRSWRKSENSELQRPDVALLALVGASLLLELVFSLNWLRVYAVSMAGIILFVWLLDHADRRRYFVSVVWLAVLAVAVQRVWTAQTYSYRTADLPAGTCTTQPADYVKLTWVMQRTKPGDFLFEAGWPGVYIPLELRNPVFLDTASTMLNPQWAQRVVQELETRQVRYILWADRLNYPPDSRHPVTTHIVPLRDYLRAHYQRTRIFPDGEEAWERK
jgi:hypothetical protein